MATCWLAVQLNPKQDTRAPPGLGTTVFPQEVEAECPTVLRPQDKLTAVAAPVQASFFGLEVHIQDD